MNKINHLAIIMDGNQRWSKKNKISLEKAYNKGFEKLLEVTNYCIKKNINYLTVYALSTENIERKSVNLIFDLIKKKYKKLLNDISKSNLIKIKIIGEKKNLSRSLFNILDEVEKNTKNQSKINLNIAFNYGTDEEVINILKKSLKIGYKPEEINTKIIKSFMYLKDTPDPDILVRTGGFHRLSNFLLLNLKYTELFFTKTLWPDITINEINDILNSYLSIERKYGL